MLRFSRNLIKYLNTKPIQPRLQYTLPLPKTRTDTVANRVIGFAEYGVAEDKAKFTILYFHGTPACRLEPSIHSFEPDCPDLYTHNHIRLICIERPGFGLSSPVTDSTTVLEVAHDIQTLIEQTLLRIPKQIYILGFSAGAPYALACTYLFPPSRVVSTAIISGVVDPRLTRATYSAWGLVEQGFLRLPGGLQALCYEVVIAAVKFDLSLSIIVCRMLLPPSSELVEKLQALLVMLQEATSSSGGYQAVMQDTRRNQSLQMPWGFTPEALTGRSVSLFYSLEDWTVAPQDAKVLEKATGHRVHWLNGGHLCFHFHLRDILLEQVLQ